MLSRESRVKIPAEVLEQLEEHHPQMAEEVRRRMDDKGRIEVSDSRVRSAIVE